MPRGIAEFVDHMTEFARDTVMGRGAQAPAPIDGVRIGMTEVPSNEKIKSVAKCVLLDEHNTLNLRYSLAKNDYKADLETRELEHIAERGSAVITKLYKDCLAASIEEDGIGSLFGEEISPQEARELVTLIRNLDRFSIKRHYGGFSIFIQSKIDGKVVTKQLVLDHAMAPFNARNNDHLNNFFFDIENLIVDAASKDKKFKKESGYEFWEAYMNNWCLAPRGPRNYAIQEPLLQREETPPAPEAN